MIQLGDKKKIYQYYGKPEFPEFHKFIESAKKNKAPRYYRSSYIPPNNHELDVMFVSSKTFEKEVIQSEKNVVVFFYPGSQNCEECVKLLSQFQNNSEILNPRYPSLKFMKCDINGNEFGNLKISTVPEIILFPANNKREIRIPNKQATSMEFAYFLNSNIPGINIDPTLFQLKDEIKTDL